MSILSAREPEVREPRAPRLASSRSMRAKFEGELASAGLPNRPDGRETITEAHLEPLPKTAQRYLRFMRVVDRKRDWSFRAHWFGRFRMAPDRAWMPCEAWQYDTRLAMARICHLRMHLGHLVPVLARDVYVEGHGRMLGRAFDRFSFVDGKGFELDVGELVTYLNDALVFAPSMLLGPETTWLPYDDGAFDVSLVDSGHTVTGRVFVDERGAMTDFATRDRFVTDPARPKVGMVRALWTTPIDGWRALGDRPLPTRTRAVWHLPSGDFCYAELSFEDGKIDWNVGPG